MGAMWEPRGRGGVVPGFSGTADICIPHSSVNGGGGHRSKAVARWGGSGGVWQRFQIKDALL